MGLDIQVNWKTAHLACMRPLVRFLSQYKSSVVTRACNPSTKEVEEEGAGKFILGSYNHKSVVIPE